MSELEQEFLLTAELYGKTFSPGAARMLAKDLSAYSESVMIEALRICRMELRTFPTVSDIIARISDSRPGPQEAWAMIPKDESASCVWTDESREAFGVARHLLESDPIAARMAFLEKYQALVTEARRNKKPARWSPSLGFDKAGQQAALVEAVDRGRLTASAAAALLPDGFEMPGGKLLQLAGPSTPESAQVVNNVRKLMAGLLQDAPIEKQVAALKKSESQAEQTAHEERVKKQLEALKSKELE